MDAAERGTAPSVREVRALMGKHSAIMADRAGLPTAKAAKRDKGERYRFSVKCAINLEMP
jgi:hypothetical protein